MPQLGTYRLVESYEMESMMNRIQDVLDDKGILTVEDYKDAFMETRNENDVPKPEDFPQL